MNAKTLAAQFIRQNGHVFDGEPDYYSWNRITKPALDRLISEYLNVLQGSAEKKLRWNGFPDNPETGPLIEEKPILQYVGFLDHSRRYGFHEHISFPHWTSIQFSVERHVELMLRYVRKAVQRFNSERLIELDENGYPK